MHNHYHQNHNNNNFAEYVTENPIIIRKDCLLSANCVILPGVELGEHTIVAADANLRIKISKNIYC